MADKFFKASVDCKNVVDFLKKKVEQFKDLSPLMKVARVFLKNTVNKNFETEGTHTGEKWPEWSEEYKEWRLKHGKSGGKIMTLDGHLRRDIRAKSGKDFAMVGTNKVYAALHNFGGNGSLKRNKTMKKREFMRMDDVRKDELWAELYIKAEEMLMEGAPGK